MGLLSNPLKVLDAVLDPGSAITGTPSGATRILGGLTGGGGGSSLQKGASKATKQFQDITGRAPNSAEAAFIARTGAVPSQEAFAKFGPLDGGGGGGGAPSNMTITQETIIPDFLKPIIQAQHQRTVIGNKALEDLKREIGKGNLVAPLNADQLQGLDLARGVAGSEGLQQAIETVRQTAAGEAPGLAQGQGGLDVLQQFAEGGAPALAPDDEFQGAFEAAVRRAQPGIFSQFAQAGRTGSGLAQTAQTQAQADAFANLFNARRSRQFNAALTLGNLFNAERGRQLNAAQVFPDLALSPSRIVGNVGDVLQNQAQRERTAPLQAKQGFASTAAGSAIPVNVGALTGTQTTQPAPQSALIQNLTAAGIDPSSPEGREIIVNALGGGGGSGDDGGGFNLGSGIAGGIGGAGTGFAIGNVPGAFVGGALGFLSGSGLL
jgi:hypothetical protein